MGSSENIPRPSTSCWFKQQANTGTVMTKRDGREVGFKDGSKFKLRVRFSLMLSLFST